MYIINYVNKKLLRINLYNVEHKLNFIDSSCRFTATYKSVGVTRKSYIFFSWKELVLLQQTPPRSCDLSFLTRF